MKTLIASTVAVSAIASAASADFTFSFTNQKWSGFQFNNVSAIAGGFTGTLTGVSVNATLVASVAFTYADDLCIYVDVPPLSEGGLLQVGGFSDLLATQRLAWTNGGSAAPGTVVNSARSVNPISFSGASQPTIWIGNGYGDPAASGTWTGTVTLIGVNAIPAPGAIALLGVAGLGAGRRRRA